MFISEFLAPVAHAFLLLIYPPSLSLKVSELGFKLSPFLHAKLLPRVQFCEMLIDLPDTLD
jgi:hypothetical protein